MSRIDRIVIVVWHDDEEGKDDPQQYDLTFEGERDQRGPVPTDQLALYREEVEEKLKDVLDRIEHEHKEAR